MQYIKLFLKLFALCVPLILITVFLTRSKKAKSDSLRKPRVIGWAGEDLKEGDNLIYDPRTRRVTKEREP